MLVEGFGSFQGGFGGAAFGRAAPGGFGAQAAQSSAPAFGGSAANAAGGGGGASGSFSSGSYQNRQGGNGGGSVDRDALWEEFRASPNSFWDNREKKFNPKAPDFKHKQSGEGLWVSSSPAWFNLTDYPLRCAPPLSTPLLNPPPTLHVKLVHPQTNMMFSYNCCRCTTWCKVAQVPVHAICSL